MTLMVGMQLSWWCPLLPRQAWTILLEALVMVARCLTLHFFYLPANKAQKPEVVQQVASNASVEELLTGAAAVCSFDWTLDACLATDSSRRAVTWSDHK